MCQLTAIALVLGAAAGQTVPLWAAGEQQRADVSAGGAPTKFQRQFLDTYCVTCHNERRKENAANLALDTQDVRQAASNATVWEKVLRKLRVGAMPPVGVRRPEAEEYAAFIASLEATLDGVTATVPDPGRPPIHRLNRLQYTNAIRDLFGLDIDGRSMLPADDTGYGFDNIGDVLTMSPGLLDRYLIVAAQISRLAVSGGATRPRVATYTLPYLSLGQDDRMSESLPFGSRGGTAIEHHFPAAGEYSLTLFLQRSDLAEGYIPRGLDVASQIDVRLDRQRLKMFTVGGRAPRGAGPDSAERAYTGVGDPYDPEAGLEVRFVARAGVHTVGISFNRDFWVTEGLGVSRLPLTNAAFSRGRTTAADVGRVDAGLDRVDIDGPFNPVADGSGGPVMRRFSCWPARPAEEESCAGQIVRTLARRAYRRPVTDAEVDALFDFYRRGRAEGGFEAGMRAAIQRLLVDVNFLFRLERDPTGVEPGMPYRISDLELASRLAFFLWSSIPDDELLDLAASGVLRTRGVLEQQVHRMLADPRAAAFVESFFGQWLTIRNVASHKPDPKVYPQFDENLRAAFEEETRLFLEYQLRADRPALELFTADYTFVNERLAHHYGIPSVYGAHFRRVTLPDAQRGGLLGQGSVLTVTSYVNRTSVVIRGKWILETLLGVPPPPPPPNVPSLDQTEVIGSLRQRMELHRKNPVCASCHKTIDPLGFALENFDGIGAFRTVDGGAPVDPSGVLVNGTKFSGPADFRQALMRYDTALLTNLTEKLVTYALGRGVEASDMPAVRHAIRQAAPEDYRWSALILAIVDSVPFQMRRAEP